MAREIPSEVARLDGHTQQVRSVSFSADGTLLASKADDNSVRFWCTDKWQEIQAARIHEANGDRLWIPTIAFHPKKPLLATFGESNNDAVNIWDINFGALSATAAGAVRHTTGKIVLVGNHSVGKSALGYRMIYDEFKEQASTHGERFWVFPALGKRRADETECEAILWDFAGQPDYRLVHALFVDDADLALVLFDAADIHNPLHGVGFWIRQLQTGPNRCAIVLVAAQTDRGTCVR